MSSPSLHEKWTELASKLRAEAKALPAGRARDQILQQAERLETAIAIEASFRSPHGRSHVLDDARNQSNMV